MNMEGFVVGSFVFPGFYGIFGIFGGCFFFFGDELGGWNSKLAGNGLDDAAAARGSDIKTGAACVDGSGFVAAIGAGIDAQGFGGLFLGEAELQAGFEKEFVLEGLSHGGGGGCWSLSLM